MVLISAISCSLWSSVYECQRVECVFTCPVRTECGIFVMYCMSCQLVVRGCTVLRSYVNVCNSDGLVLLICTLTI